VPTRDYNNDKKVNFLDYAVFASHWLAGDCDDPNWCDGTDLDFDGDVDSNDLGLFVEYWPWRWSTATLPDPNGGDPNHPEDPNVVCSIVDANGSNEITINVGDSITLYVDIATTEENNIRSFDIEVNISNTTLGSIDNTEYDSNNPPGPGTARILVEPRDTFFDYWGPGFEQEEGIGFFAITNIGDVNAMSDGHLASFIFTCEGQGDVTLELISWDSLNMEGEAVFPKLEDIVIHQVAPNSQQITVTGS